MNRRTTNLALILMLLMVSGGLRDWPVQLATATEGPGFEWKMVPRHTGRTLIDPNDLAGAKNYVSPTAGYEVSFDGCETVEDPSQAVTHAYPISGDSLTEPRVVSARATPKRPPGKLGGGLGEISCGDLKVTTSLPQGSYDVFLQVATGLLVDTTTTTYPPRSILVKDLLIISVGDSYGSGEGAPDKEVQYGLFGYATEPAVWQDQNCHRSAWAGPSQAAAILEHADPYTSVTFISLACSGATINTPIDDNPDDGKINGATFQGAGLLAPYSGIEPKGNFDENMGPWQPTQMEQAARIANSRSIDALTISGGGNDMHFATVIADCVLSDCSSNETTRKRLDADFEQLPVRYQELADFINGDRNRNGAPALNITSDRVFITEYPDPTRNANGDWCETNQIDDPLLSLPATGIMKHEMAWASANVVNRLNDLIEAEATKHGWNTVNGIAAEFYGDPSLGLHGRGWCALGADANGAPNNWVNRSTDALAIQGPISSSNPVPIGLWAIVGAAGIVLAFFTSGWSLLVTGVAITAVLLQLKSTDGAMHPNRMGQMVYARHIASSIQARLSGKIAVPGDTTPPTIESARNITVETMDGAGEIVNYPIPATNDDTDGAGLASCSPASGSLFQIGTTRVICTARDASGNVATPVGFSVIVDPITVSLPSAPDGETSLRSGCTKENGDNQYLANDAGPLSFNGTNVTGFTGGNALKARASATDDDCGMHLTHSTGVTVGAGDTGLDEGEPVLVSITLGLDGFLSSSAEGNEVSVLSMDADYSITETNCPDSGPAPMSAMSEVNDTSTTSGSPGFDLGGEGGGYCPSIMDFSASVDMNHYGNTDQWYTRGGWSITDNIGDEQGEYRDIYCDDYCSDPSHLPFDTGSRTVIFETRVGAHLELNNSLDVFATGYLGSTAVSDFSNTFAVSMVQPAPGYEGLTFTYDNADPTDPGTGNGTPTVDAGGPYSVDEGGSVSVTAVGSDPDGDELTYAWDLDGDGTFETTGATATFSAANLDGPVSRTIAVQVTDGELTATDGTTIQVLNVAPTATISGMPATLAEGTSITLTGSAVDPSAADTFTYVWNLSKDGSPYASGSGESFTFTPDNNGHYAVALVATDDDGGASSPASAEITVTNVTPVVSLSDDTTLRRGETFNGTGSFADPGADSWTVVVNYGDGSVDEALQHSPEKTFDLNHTYTTAGVFDVTVCVTDDGGEGCDTLSVTVTPYAIFAGMDDCDGNGDPAIQWSGSKGSIIGDLHSNAGVKVSGSNNRVDGDATYRCTQQVNGKDNTFATEPTSVTEIRPWPVTLTRDGFTCDVDVPGKLDLSNDGNWWVGGTSKSGQLEPMALCADEIVLSGSNITGSVTLVADTISISGSNLSLTPDQHGILVLATGTSSEAIKISGSTSQWSGDLVAMAGGIGLSGANNTMTDGGVIGWTVTLSGSGWTIDATP